MLNRDEFKAALAALALLALWGCAHRPSRALNYFVGEQCHLSAQLKDCDQAEPPNCQKATLKFGKACEQIEAKR